MRYFGVPACPYCKKRVNLIRTWSLKKQGEYICPRCGGISNIYLSPLIYVFALLAVFSGGTVYFFHRFILDDLELATVFQVMLPFVIFFLLSLFMVYLAKPVIKKVQRKQKVSRSRRESRGELRQVPAFSEEEYNPRPQPAFAQEDEDDDMKIYSPSMQPAQAQNQTDISFDADSFAARFSQASDQSKSTFH